MQVRPLRWSSTFSFFVCFSCSRTRDPRQTGAWTRFSPPIVLYNGNENRGKPLFLLFDVHAMHFTQIRRFPDRLLSTVHRGTAFEYRALALLTKHMSMSLMRVGGKHDGGIDLIGWWWVPCEKACAYRAIFQSSPTQSSIYASCRSTLYINPLVFSDPLDATTSEPEPPRNSNTANRRRLRVLAQCKAEKRKMGPAYLRELEGVVYRHAALAAAATTTPAYDASLLLHRRLPPLRDLTSTSDPPPPRPAITAPASASVLTSPATTPMTTTKHPPVVAILVSQSEFTRNCLLAAHASPLPFLLVHLPATSTTTSSSSSKRSSSGAGSAALGAVFGNPALVSARGVLGGDLEIRWERGTGAGVLDAGSGGARGGGGGGRPGLWWQGQPLPSWTPDAEAADGALLERR